MPVYLYKCPTCGHGREVVKPIRDIDLPEQCLNCSFYMNRQICAPAVRGDYAGYNCPVTGKWVEGKRAHEENLARHGCRVLEPGESKAAARSAEQSDAALESKLDSTVEQLIHEMPARKREQLIAEVQSGASAEVVRSTPNL